MKNRPGIQQTIRHTQYFLTACFILVGLGLVYWQLVRAGSLRARADNPRLIVAQQQIRRGEIRTGDGIPLAETIIGADGLARRHYPYPLLAPVTGYYSIRYGTGGLEAAFDPRLRGDTPAVSEEPAWLDELLHRPPVGGSITVTIDLNAQVAADLSLSETGTTGVVLVLEGASGAVRVLASRPTYDPNQLEATWEGLIRDPNAPLLNRATQGLFALGDLASLVGLIGVLEVEPEAAARLDQVTDETWVSLLAAADLATVTSRLRFGRPVSFELPTVAAAPVVDWPDKAGALTVTPLHLALVGAAITNNGVAPAPYLVAVPAGDSRPDLPPLMSPETATAIKNSRTGFAGLARPEVTGNETLSWYLGWDETTTQRVVVVVVATPLADRQAAQRVAEQTLSAFD